jgi:hypothetical protein
MKPAILTRGVVAFLVVGMVNAARAEERLDCKALAFSDDLTNLSLAIVTSRKAHFVANRSDRAGCPSVSASCRTTAFLVANDKVVTDGAKDSSGDVCVAFIDGRGVETDGWLPAGSVKTIMAAPRWIGAWRRSASGKIDIMPKSGDTLGLTGTASWQGRGENVHSADIDAVIDARKTIQGFATRSSEFEGKQIPFERATAADCAVMMSQLGPYLYVSDSGNCGGANVSFVGLYARR